MNREIKFEFVFKTKQGGVVISPPISLDFIIKNATTEEEILESMEPPCSSGSCHTKSQNHCDCESDFFDAELIAKRQYIGLKDKYGKEIYEADWCKGRKNNGQHFEGKITYVNGRYELKTKHPLYNKFFSIKIWELKDIEKIGNIYENPELLK